MKALRAVASVQLSPTSPSVGTLVGGWEVEAVSRPAVGSSLLNVVLATVVLVSGSTSVASVMSHILSLLHAVVLVDCPPPNVYIKKKEEIERERKQNINNLSPRDKEPGQVAPQDVVSLRRCFVRLHTRQLIKAANVSQLRLDLRIRPPFLSPPLPDFLEPLAEGLSDVIAPQANGCPHWFHDVGYIKDNLVSDVEDHCTNSNLLKTQCYRAAGRPVEEHPSIMASQHHGGWTEEEGKLMSEKRGGIRNKNKEEEFELAAQHTASHSWTPSTQLDVAGEELLVLSVVFCVLACLFFIPRSVSRGGERCERSGVGLPGLAGGASAVVWTAVSDEPFKPPGDNIQRNS
ncbi:hypothetical protein EYF80_031855 [Liparis tanakae]|uniref:Uncharacterized protein n=1 Tax=Liparis tanakae TaxID=230148 RepID=A0A4Z2GWW6_9TELE|nr:hypothetical protein EYF80_031855 [Liparis tanakae]